MEKKITKTLLSLNIIILCCFVFLGLGLLLKKTASTGGIDTEDVVSMHLCNHYGLVIEDKSNIVFCDSTKLGGGFGGGQHIIYSVIDYSNGDKTILEEFEKEKDYSCVDRSLTFIYDYIIINDIDSKYGIFKSSDFVWYNASIGDKSFKMEDPNNTYFGFARATFFYVEETQYLYVISWYGF